MPDNLSAYRIFDRKKFVVIMAVLLSVVAVGVWVGLDRLADYAKQLEEITATDPAKGASIVTQKLRWLAVLNGILLTSLAILITWHGLKGLRTASMPPKGSWILEGQRVWTGQSAVRIAKFTITVGALLLVLALVSSLILWRIGDMFQG
jgi:hypothetical protein